MSTSRRSFGGLRELPSGRFQATYRDPETGRRVPQTFDTVDEADHWLQAVSHSNGRRVRTVEVRPTRRGRAGRRSFGAIRQLPSGRWQASFVDGNAFRHKAPSTFPSKSEADQWLARQQTHLVGGDWTDPRRGRISFADLAEAFFRTHETAVRSTTLRRDREYADRYLIPAFGKMAIAAIDLETVQGWVARLSKSGGAGAKPLAPATVIKANQILGKILQWGVDSRRISSNPARGVKYPRPQSPKKWVLDQAAVAQLADAIDARYRAMVFVLAYTGLRIGECLALNVADIDVKAREVSVSKRVVDLTGHLDMDEPKTEEAVRTVPMPSLVLREVADHIRRSQLGPEDPLFPAPEGGHYRYHAWRRRVWHAAVDKVGLVDSSAGRFRPHGLRKTAITVWLDAGVPIEEAAAWCGHKNVTVMYKHYKARQAEMGRAQISKVDAVLRPSAERNPVSSTSRVDRVLSSQNMAS